MVVRDKVCGEGFMRRFPTLAARVLFVLLITLASGEAQDRFRTTANAVLVDVCVTAKDGRYVPALAAGDFLVLDNDQPQHVMFFAGEENLPLAVTLLIDRSGSMNGSKLDAAESAALDFVDTLRPHDLLEVIAFNDTPSRLFPLGSDHAVAKQSLSGLSGQGATRLWDAAILGLRDLERSQHHQKTRYRHAMLILSDGDDEKSVIPFDYLLDGVRRSDVIVYAISFRSDDDDRWLAPPRELAQLAFDSGGRAVAVGTADGLARVYQELGAEIRSLYRIGFMPMEATDDGQWRAISVRVPGRDVHVRARSGYYSPRRAPQ
jgi:VWFA-related protein